MNIDKIKSTNKCPDPVPELKKFWAKVKIIDDEKSCWEFTGSRDKDGYGRIGVERKGFKKTYKAHRLSWTLQNGPIPDENCICHRCDNPPCVRPDHLELGTVWDNNHDKEKKNRDARGERNGMRRLSERHIQEIRDFWDTGQYTQSDLGAIYEVSQSAISKIVTRKRWQHVGFEEFMGDRKEKGI